jgi:hypothetical protein
MRSLELLLIEEAGVLDQCLLQLGWKGWMRSGYSGMESFDHGAAIKMVCKPDSDCQNTYGQIFFG